MNWNKTALFGMLILSTILSSCIGKYYNFRGANIPDDVTTFSVSYFNNEASLVNPSFSLDFTEKVKTKFQTETQLGLKAEEGDYKIGGVIKNYSIAPAAINVQTGAAQTQFTIIVNVEFECVKYPEKNFTRDFTSSITFDAGTDFSSVESSLSNELSDIIVQQIFSAIALDW